MGAETLSVVFVQLEEQDGLGEGRLRRSRDKAWEGIILIRIKLVISSYKGITKGGLRRPGGTKTTWGLLSTVKGLNLPYISNNSDWRLEKTVCI